MITELNNIKEVEITEKTDFKYYMLYVYNKTVDYRNRYFLLTQSTEINDLEHYKKTWNLNEGDEFKVFAVMLPS